MGVPSWWGASNLSFNLSHTADLAVFAIGRGRAVGVDIEALARRPPSVRMIARTLNPGELARVMRAGGRERTEAFLRYWTIKEAYTKALGVGLAFDLRNIAVSGRAERPTLELAGGRAERPTLELAGGRAERPNPRACRGRHGAMAGAAPAAAPGHRRRGGGRRRAVAGACARAAAMLIRHVCGRDPANRPELEQAAWDLKPLVGGDGEAGVQIRLEEALTRAQAFAERYAGKLGELDGAGLREAMQELAAIYELVGRAGTYAGLRFSTDTANPANGALLQMVQERETALETTLLFFELEWAALPQERAEELLADPGLDFCRHHLRNVRRYREHLLTEPEEKILSEKSLTGATAWARLFEELTSGIEVELNDERVALDVALSRLALADREVRRTAAEAVTAALAPGLRTRGYVLNTLLADKSVDDRLRRYPNWLAARNLANEASDESVQALIEAVRGRYELARRWYRLKAQLLGIDRLADYDRMAAVTQDEVSFTYTQARELVLDCYSSFSPELGALAGRFFAERWIDAPVRPSKRGGAFCASAVPSAHPYVLLNYTARRRDVLTLAHELGHGVHFALAARQGTFIRARR